MQFKDIIGQTETRQHLTDMLQQNRLSHALLFLGKEGNGSLNLARAFAQYVVCEKVNGMNKPTTGTSLFGEEPISNGQPFDKSDSCGQCSACMKAAKLVHPDIHFSFPIISIKKDRPTVSNDMITEWRKFILENPYGNSYDWLQAIEAENKQGNITSKECEEIIKKLMLKSFESKHKILIMWMPEYLGNEGNKLLKLIEEPPADTLMIFVAENEQQILPTILSRTQLVKVPMLFASAIAQQLVEDKLTDADNAQQIALMSEGNYREALRLLQHADDNWELLLRDWMNSIVRTGPAAQVKWVEDVAKIGREKQKQFLQYFNHVLSHAVRLKAMGDAAFDPSLAENETQSAISGFAGKINRLCHFDQLEALVREIDQATYHVERNANAKILFHALTIRIYYIISNKSVILVP